MADALKNYAAGQVLTGSLKHFTFDADVELAYAMYGLSGGTVALGGTEDAFDYAIDDVLTLVGGTSNTTSTVTIDSLTIGAVSVTTAGTTYTNGTHAVTLTGGTFTIAAILSVVVAGGLITGVTVTRGGSYSVIPSEQDTLDDIEGGAAGAGDGALELNTDWDVGTYTVTVAGEYTVLPSNPVDTTNSGAGTGATLTAVWVADNSLMDLILKTVSMKGTVVQLGVMQGSGVFRMTLENASPWTASDLQTAIATAITGASRSETITVADYDY